ncbi:MAG: DNA repair protein RecO [Patescibacteria group bacterium]|nr:DNA repair protein RecO [Patescibacteria group bacterium]
MPGTYKTTGLVLRRRPFRETDRWFVVLTPDRGKLELLGRGASKIKSKLAAHLEPFSYVQLLVASGKQTDTVVSAVLIKRFQTLSQNIVKKTWADYIAEIVDCLLPVPHADPIMFRMVGATWKNLDSIRLSSANDYVKGLLIITGFALKIFSRVGYQPELFYCGICRRRVLQNGNAYNFSHGGLICPACQGGTKNSRNVMPVTGSTIRILRYALKQPYGNIRRLKVPREQMREVRKFIDQYVTFHLEKEPKSVKFLRYFEKKSHLPSAQP